jgi:predicted alpha/beta-hydrolase family hydrolase
VEVDLGGHPGLLLRPADARVLYVLAHGAGAGMRHAFMIAIAEQLAARGVATLRWEFPFMAAGKPRPDPAAVAEASVRTVWNAARALDLELPMFAGGKSFGGRMTSRAHAAAPLEDLRGIAFLGFPLHPPEKPAPKRERGGFSPPRAIDRAEHLASAKGPLLFVQGTRDDLADLALLKPVVKQLGARAKLHIIEHADHGFEVLKRSGRTPEEVVGEIATTVATWMKRIAGAPARSRATRTITKSRQR